MKLSYKSNMKVLSFINIDLYIIEDVTNSNEGEITIRVNNRLNLYLLITNFIKRFLYDESRTKIKQIKYTPISCTPRSMINTWVK